MYIFIHTYIHTFIHTYIHTHIYTYTHTCIHTYIQTDTDRQTDIQQISKQTNKQTNKRKMHRQEQLHAYTLGFRSIPVSAFNVRDARFDVVEGNHLDKRPIDKGLLGSSIFPDIHQSRWNHRLMADGVSVEYVLIPNTPVGIIPSALSKLGLLPRLGSMVVQWFGLSRDGWLV